MRLGPGWMGPAFSRTCTRRTDPLRVSRSTRRALAEVGHGKEEPRSVASSSFPCPPAAFPFRRPATRIVNTLKLTGKAKDLSQPYRGGERSWYKIKRRETTDAVCGAVIGPLSRPTQLILGVHDAAGELRFAGRTGRLGSVQASIAAGFLRPPAGEHPWPEEVPAAAFDRFARDRGLVRLTLVEPVVVEVSADAARSGIAFRHSVRLIGFRPDLDPASVASEAG